MYSGAIFFHSNEPLSLLYKDQEKYPIVTLTIILTYLATWLFPAPGRPRNMMTILGGRVYLPGGDISSSNVTLKEEIIEFDNVG